jgi:hypothetical protein
MSYSNAVVTLPDTVAPVELPETSGIAYDIWEARALSDNDTRVTSDGETRIVADLKTQMQVAVIELPGTIAPVEVD